MALSLGRFHPTKTLDKCASAKKSHCRRAQFTCPRVSAPEASNRKSVALGLAWARVCPNRIISSLSLAVIITHNTLLSASTCFLSPYTNTSSLTMVVTKQVSSQLEWLSTLSTSFNAMSDEERFLRKVSTAFGSMLRIVVCVFTLRDDGIAVHSSAVDMQRCISTKGLCGCGHDPIQHPACSRYDRNYLGQESSREDEGRIASSHVALRRDTSYLCDSR
jgi:hypothetical protein